MHKLNEDCYYFLTASCAKGAGCLYRHNPLALKSNVICPAWIRGQCLDSACPLRHSNAAQRPMISNGIMCFYENMPTGCLKVDCTFIHTRPRVHLTNPSLVRSSSMNLIKKEVSKSPSTSTPPVSIPVVPMPSTLVEPASNNTTTTTTIEADPISPKRKTEIAIRRVALNTDNETTIEKPTTPVENSLKVTTRSVITSVSEEKPEETNSNTNSNRLVVNRNVVRPEPFNTPTRTIVQATTSNRVVVRSETNLSSSSSSVLKVKRNSDDVDKLVEQENQTKKLKSDSPTITNNATPTSSSNNRLLLLATKQITTTTKTEDPKAVRLNRNRLPTKKSSNGNVSVTLSISTKEQKKSTGTGLSSQDDVRRTNRLERFKNKPNSPPTSNHTQQINSALSNRNVVTLTLNGVKRVASVAINQNTPPAKRPSTSQSSPIVNHLSVNDKMKVKSLVKSVTSTPSPISMDKKKSTPVMIKRPPVTIPTSSETSKESTQLIDESMKILNEENADSLLKVTDSSNVVDTFALIDAALLEADHLLDLI